MFRGNILFSIFNWDMLEDTKQHYFLCEVVWIVRQVQDEAILRAKIITTFRGSSLNWYMKLSVVLAGNHQKSLYHIRSWLVNESKKPM